jgi:predicted glutamine amidotransferase
VRGYPVWIAENLPVSSLNLIITTPTDMWALPYPATHELNVLERDPGGRTHGHPLQADSHRIHGHSPALATARSVIIASERMDNDRGWRIIEPCELLHIDVNLTPTAAGRYPQPLPIR